VRSCEKASGAGPFFGLKSNQDGKRILKPGGAGHVAFVHRECLFTGGKGNDKGDSVVTVVEPFELTGSWEYTGGVAGLTDLMEISEDQVENTGDYN
jgi:hypothetical protein